MKITIKFNIGMTFAVIGYSLLLYPLLSDTPLLIDSLIPGNLTLQFIIIILSIGLAIPASMYIIRALWNRLFPNLCGWKEINLAESYALSLFLGLFFIQ
jgi:hypothetical protein